MTKLEYMTALQNRALWISDSVPLDIRADLSKNGELKAYEVNALVLLSNGSVQGQNQTFYVISEGEAGEEAYSMNQDRKDVIVNPFKAQVRAYLDNNHINATRPKITIDSVNEEHEFALVTAYELVADQITIVRYFLAKDDQGNPYIKEFV